MRVKHHDKRKTLLSIGKQIPKALRELQLIRGDTVEFDDEFDTHADRNRTIKLMKKKKAAFFISAKENGFLNIGRVFDGEFLELLKFKITKMLSSEDFKTVPAEMFVKYYILLQNISSPRMENLLLDIFNQKSAEANLHGLKYAWVFSRIDKKFTLKFTRVMNDLSVEDIGPYFELELENEYFCSDELFNKACVVEETKKTKNVEKTVFKDVVGTIHIDKQDLKDVQLKKNRGYKNKEVNEELNKKPKGRARE